MHISSKYLFSSLFEDFCAALLEFVGTFTFLLLGLGGIQATIDEAANDSTRGTSGVQRILYISTCMGFSLLVSAWLFFRVTGSLFNPNISLSLLLVGVIRPVRFVMYCIAQLLGAIAASAVVLGLTSSPLAVNTALSTETSPAKGVFIEMFITAALVLSVLMLAAEKHQATPFAPIGIGLTLFSGHLFAVYYTGAAMNTARAFGPAVITGFSGGHHWVYWVGPFLGSLLASIFYSLLKHYRYWVIVPDQATDDPTKSPYDPVTKAKTILAEHSLSAGSRVEANSNAPRKNSIVSSHATMAATNGGSGTDYDADEAHECIRVSHTREMNEKESDKSRV